MITTLGVGAAPFDLRDLFIDTRSAGSIDGTLAVPGPGTRLVVDTSGLITINGTAARINGGISSWSGNPRLGYSDGIVRTPGKIISFKFINNISGVWRIGLDANTTGTPDEGNLYWDSSLIRLFINGNDCIVPGSIIQYYNHSIYFALRKVGFFCFVHFPGHAYPELLYISNYLSNSPLYPAITQYSGSVISLSDVAVSRQLFLPIPLVSDGFSSNAPYITDGLGHAEGVDGGVGSGGAGIAWIDSVGTWQNSGGQSNCTSIPVDRALRIIESNSADVIVSYRQWYTTGIAGAIVRYIDDQNYIYVSYHSGGGLINLRKVVSGVESDMFVSEGGYMAAGARATIICRGDQITLFTNDSIRAGGSITITDPILLRGTKIGLFSSNTANKFDDFCCWPVGTGGEYSTLCGFVRQNISLNYMGLGDSKTQGNRYQAWISTPSLDWTENPARIAVGGSTSVAMAAEIDADLATRAGTPQPRYVLLNLGANDYGTAEADWKTATTYILDAIHAKWPQTKIYLMDTWRQGQDAWSDTLATWRHDVIATRYFSFIGPDERIFLKGADDGATYTVDGIHPNTAGDQLTALEWSRSINPLP